MKEQLALEYIKYLKNPAYMIEKNFRTLDLTQGGYVPFKLFPRQRDIIRALVEHRHNLITKPRQAGVSTTVAAYLAAILATADPDKPEVIMIIANKATLAQQFMSKIKDFLQHVPTWVWGEYYDHNKATDGHIVGKGSVKKLTLLNKSTVMAVATSTDALRGYTPTYLVVDEAAYIDNGRELYTASMSSLNTGGKMILISTPNGLDELYYRTYAASVEGKNNFNVVELKWYQDPRYSKDLEWVKYDEFGEEIERLPEETFDLDGYEEMVKKGYKPTSSWYREACANLNYDKLAIARELEVKFEGSGGNVIEYSTIEKLEKKCVIDPISKEWYDKNLWIWELPIEGHEYVMGVDVSTGNGKDFSTIKIIDLTTMNEVVEYKGKIKPQELSKLIMQIGYKYNAYTVVDTTGGYGDTTIYELEKNDYNLLHYSEVTDDFLRRKAYEDNNYNKTKIAGIRVGTSSKRIRILRKYITAIEQGELNVKSIRHVNEMKTYVWRNGRPDHMRGFNDDVIFATALAVWIGETEFKKIKKAKEQTTIILNSWNINGVNISRSDVEKRKQIIEQRKKTKRVVKSKQDPTGQYSWLFN